MNYLNVSHFLPNQSIEQFHMDLAASIQEVTEEVVLKIARNLKKRQGQLIYV